jgi:hypothetical protein
VEELGLRSLKAFLRKSVETVTATNPAAFGGETGIYIYALAASMGDENMLDALFLYLGIACFSHSHGHREISFTHIRVIRNKNITYW